MILRRGVHEFHRRSNIYDADAHVRNNTIYSGSGLAVDGGCFAISISDCSPTIENNIIFTGSSNNMVAIHEHDDNATPSVLRNNLFFRFVPEMVLYFDWDTCNVTGERSANSER